MTKYEYLYDSRQYDPAQVTVVPQLGGRWLVDDFAPRRTATNVGRRGIGTDECGNDGWSRR